MHPLHTNCLQLRGSMRRLLLRRAGALLAGGALERECRAQERNVHTKPYHLHRHAVPPVSPPTCRRRRLLPAAPAPVLHLPLLPRA